MIHPVEHGDGGSECRHNMVCPICSQTFVCTASASCWCASTKIPEEVTAYLAARYSTCVCRSCLEELSRKSLAGESLS